MADPDSEDQSPNHDSYLVPGLQRGLQVLEAISDAGSELTISEIARGIGVSRSSAFRLVYTLRHMGFIEEKNKSYSLGPRILNLGFAYLSSQSIVEVARRDLEALRDATGICAHLSIRSGREVLYLECVQPRTGFLSNINVGTRVPAYASPAGWLLLSELTHAEITALFKDREFQLFTERTPRDQSELAMHISRSVSAGHAISRGAMEAGGSSIAAPVVDKAGHVLAAVDISGPDSAFDLDKIETFYLSEVRNAAERISQRVGTANLSGLS